MKKRHRKTVQRNGIEKRYRETAKWSGIKLVAKKMLKLNIPIKDIANATGLMEEEILNLKK